MGNPNRRAVTAEVQPPKDLVLKKPFGPIPSQNKPKNKLVDLRALAKHPAITVVSNNRISIYIEMCVSMPEPVTDITSLLAVLPEYESVKKISIKIHAPWPKTESREMYNKRVSLMKRLFNIINKFKLYNLNVIISIDGLNFPQMKLGAVVHELTGIKWQLFYQVYDEVKEIEHSPLKIFRGSEYDLRLRGVYKKEFVSSA